MEENKRKRINVDITEKEAEIVDAVLPQIKQNLSAGLSPDYNIPRIQFEMVSKYITPFVVVANQFIETQKGRGNSPATIKHYQQSIKKLFRFFSWLSDVNDNYDKMTDAERVADGEAQPFCIFERDNIESEFRDFLIEVEEVSEITVATYFRDYRAIAYWLMDMELIKRHTITIRNVEADVKEVYTDEEIAKLLRKPRNDCSFAEYRDWVVIHHMLATGNRISTICNIKINDIDWNDCMLAIQVQKNKRKARIPIEVEYANVLEEYVNTWLIDENGKYVSEYLFPSSYAASTMPMNRNTLGNSIAQYNKSRGVKKTSTHLFRHTFAKHWIVAGKDLHSLQKMLGHSTLDMVTHYAILINGQTVEVKTDYRMYETGNLLLEMVSNSNPAYYKEGWFITSKAQVFVFYSPQTNSTYQVFADELRKVVFDNQSQLKYRNMRVNEFGNVIKETQICLVPINFVRNNCETFRQEVMD